MARRLTEAPAFESVIIAIIIINGVLLGLATSETLDRQYGYWIAVGNHVALGIFIAEALLKMIASSPPW